MEYTQEQIDNMIAAAKQRVEKKYEHYMAPKDFEALKAENSKLHLEVKKPHIEELALKAGCNKEAVKHFVSINSDLLSAENDEAINNLIETKKKKEFSYMFQQNKQNSNAGLTNPFTNQQINSNGDAKKVELNNLQRLFK